MDIKESLVLEGVTSAEVAQACQEQESLEPDGRMLPADALQCSRIAARTLREWGISSEGDWSVALAALLVPLLQHRAVSAADLATRYPQRAVQLAQKVVQESLCSGFSGTASKKDEAYEHLGKLQRLFRYAYIDPELVLLAMALHGSMLRLPGSSVEKRLRIAVDTDTVYIPLAEMVGAWHLRREWLDRFMDIQIGIDEDREAQYKAVIEKLNTTRDDRDKAFAELAASLCDLVEESGRQPRVLSRDSTESTCSPLFSDSESLYPVCPPRSNEVLLRERKPQVSNIMRRESEGESIDEMTSRITVEVFCESQADCYEMLGLAHRLGKPVTPRFSERFGDYIADPQPNGYQGLHTAITHSYLERRRDGRGLRRKYTLVEFRIFTTSMHQLNEWGIIRALDQQQESRRSDVSAWWNSMEDLTGSLQMKWRSTHALRSLLEAYDLGSRPAPSAEDPDPIYVFTPRGEVFLLEVGATALDFAYALHTQIGRGAQQMKVNGKFVSSQYPLRNGDIVEVTFRRVSTSDLAKLSAVRTHKARLKVRTDLLQQAERVHSGRAKLLRHLMSVLRFYRREKDYLLELSNVTFDEFLRRAAYGRGLKELRELYDQIDQGRVSPQKLVHQYISQELALAIVDQDGMPILSKYPPHHVSLCGTCVPLPGSPLRGRKHRLGVSAFGLTVHRANNPDCRGVPGEKEGIPLKWARAESGRPGQERGEVIVRADNRYGLLGDILGVLYRQPDLGLYALEAEVQQGTKAQVKITVEGVSWEQLERVRSALEAVHRVQTAQLQPVSLLRQDALFGTSVTAEKHVPNPYRRNEVYGRDMFYDRHEQIRSVKDWLIKSHAPRCLVIHGQRRVGKTSLAKHLTEEALRSEKVIPLYVDVQGFTTVKGLCDCIAAKLTDRIEYSVSEVYSGLDPSVSLERHLAAASDQIRDHKLLIMLDEFDYLMKAVEEDDTEASIFDTLQRIMKQEWHNIAFTLIVQDAYYEDPDKWGDAGELFHKADDAITVPPLDRSWTEELITGPISRYGCSLEEGVTEKIISLSGGVPYYVHILCWELIERKSSMAHRRITNDDLEAATSWVVERGDSHLYHFREVLGGLRKVVLSAVATQQETQNPTISDTMELLESKGAMVSHKAMIRTVKGLERLGILEVMGSDDGNARLNIPIGLLKRWTLKSHGLDEAVEDWIYGRASRQD